MLSKLGQLVLNFLLGKLAEWIASAWAWLRRRKEIQHDSERSVQPLKDAKTADEIDKATDSALDGF